MNFPIGAEVFCKDGLCGRSTRVILKPKTEEVTHLVVREKAFPHTEYIVPVTAVTVTTPDSINISLTSRELAKQDPFIEREYVEMNIPEYANSAYTLQGNLYLDHEYVTVEHEQIPEDEVDVRKGARVHAVDGHIGRVDEFLVDEKTKRVTHLVMQEGHLFGKKDVTIPVSAIDHVEEDTIYLKLSKDEINAQISD